MLADIQAVAFGEAVEHVAEGAIERGERPARFAEVVHPPRGQVGVERRRAQVPGRVAARGEKPRAHLGRVILGLRVAEAEAGGRLRLGQDVRDAEGVAPDHHLSASGLAASTGSSAGVATSAACDERPGRDESASCAGWHGRL